MSKIISAEELYSKYAYYLPSEYLSEDKLIEKTIRLLENEIKYTKNPYTWAHILTIDNNDDKTKYKIYTKKIRNRLESLGYKFKEEFYTFNEYEGEWQIYMAIHRP